MSQKTRGERALIGARLKDLRERAHIGIADAAKAAEVQPVAVEKWERGAALPSVLELRELVQCYGVMPCEVLFERNPWELDSEAAGELARAARNFSPSLRAKIDCLLAMMARGKEPAWR
jgi:transcriptional regulator with XRE-family HTH domain